MTPDGVIGKEDLKELFRRPPVITTERLILRKIEKKDASDVYEYASRPDVVRYLTWSAHSSPAETRMRLSLIEKAYRRGLFYDFAVVLRDGEKEGKMIGTCGFTSFDLPNRSCEVGYVINPAYSGRGYATEALCRVLRFAFCELGLHRAQARYDVDNSASRRVAEKCGMTFEGVLRESVSIGGRMRDVGVSSILSGEFFAGF